MIYHIPSLILAATLSLATASTLRAQTPSLKETFANEFLIGTALDFRTPGEFNDAELAIIKSQFNVITPENSMKPESIYDRNRNLNFTISDRLVEFCQANNIKIIGHCLAWHGQTPAWFFEGENGQPLTKEKAIERLRTHIMSEVGHFKGKIKGWDVVNEAINDRGNEGENLRPSPWIKAIGPEYLTMAFKFAHEADPDAELHYNDYNIEKGAKHEQSMLLLKRLIAEGAPITAVGIQGHWSLNNLPYEELDKAISDYKSLGLKVMITEMDISLVGQGGGQLNPTTAPATQLAGQIAVPGTQPSTQAAVAGRRGGRVIRTAPPTPDELKRQAEAYAKFFEIFRKHKDTVTRVTVWGLNDARTWRPGQFPLLYDGKNEPKPAFFLIVGTAK